VASERELGLKNKRNKKKRLENLAKDGDSPVFKGSFVEEE